MRPYPQTTTSTTTLRYSYENKSGTAILDSAKDVVETRERECTTQVGTKVSCNTTERTFCSKRTKPR